jgi:hypothetical protein
LALQAAGTASADRGLNRTIVKRRPIDMLWIIGIAAIAIVALTIVSFTLHALFSPWLLLLAVGVLVWIKVRPRRSRR